MKNPYAQVDVQTASPVALVAKLYEAAIRHCRRARDSDEIRVRAMAADRALAIVGELRQSLSLENGGEIASNLDALYEYAVDRILAGSRGQSAGFDEAIGVLVPLHEAWAELARRPLAAETAETAETADPAPAPGLTDRVEPAPP